MGKSCKDAARTLYECMKKTECVQKGGDIKECMKQGTDCQQFRTAYFECKRGGLDMRNRIQGQKAF